MITATEKQPTNASGDQNDSLATIEPLLLTAKQAAKALNISERTLWALSASGEIPKLKIGKSVRYSVADLKKWIAEQSAKNNR